MLSLPLQPVMADAATPPDIVEFWLVDADTDTRIRRIHDHDTLRLPLLPEQLSIEAVAADEADSVVMRIEGAVSATENNAPYALGSDVGGDFFAVPELRVPGWIDVSAQPFDGPDGTGDAGTETEISLYLDQPDFVVDNAADVGDYDPGDGWCTVGKPPFVADDFAVASRADLPDWELKRQLAAVDGPSRRPASPSTTEFAIVEDGANPEAAKAAVEERTRVLTRNRPVEAELVPAPIDDPTRRSIRPGKGRSRSTVGELTTERPVLEFTPPYEPTFPDGYVPPGWVPRDACTLRAAIEESNALAGRQRVVIDSAKGPFKLSLGQLEVTDGIDLIGHGGRAVVDAEKRNRVFYIAGDHLFNLHMLEVANGKTDELSRGGGIAIDHDAYVQLSDSVVRNGQANFGGGIYLQLGGDLMMVRSTVRNNVAGTPENGINGGGQTQRGGGIFNREGNVTVRDSSIFENLAVRGGGLSNFGGTFRVENSSVIDNEALGIGGGIENHDNSGHDGVLHLSFATVAHNEAGTSAKPPADHRVGGGLYNASVAKMASTILAGNTDAYSAGDALHAPDCHSTIANGFDSYRNNLVGVLNGNCELEDYSWGNTGGIDHGSEWAPLDAELTGAFWWDHRRYRNLQAGSPAIDAGGSAAAIYPCEDHDGIGRPRPVGGGCDIGAIERQ